jgi:hypothetical protein
MLMENLGSGAELKKRAIEQSPDREEADEGGFGDKAESLPICKLGGTKCTTNKSIQ